MVLQAYSYADPSVRLTGRWAAQGHAAVCTANGAYIEIAFRGRRAVLCFDLEGNVPPYPHLWVSVDGGTAVETALAARLQVAAERGGGHVLRVSMKGSVEAQSRWYAPLAAKAAFRGYEAEEAGILPPDRRPVIEFVGDSITEGVLIDVQDEAELLDQSKRVYQDDSQATYAALTARMLHLRPVFMGYGSVGVTREGCGGVPRAAEAYPYCFDGAWLSRAQPEFILINHGANDMYGEEEAFIAGYQELLEVIRRLNPNARIIALSPFCGVFAGALRELVRQFNARRGDDVLFIDSTGWIPPQPLHPLRGGHRRIADRLAAILREHYGL